MTDDRLYNKAGEQPDEENSQEETSSKEIIRRHLEDEDHVITDEEIQSVKIGLTHEEQMESVSTGAESEAFFEGEEDQENKDKEEDDDVEKKEGENPIRPATPWDVIG